MKMKILLIAALSLMVELAVAQSYPAKPVRLVVGFVAGGPTDALARLYAQRLGTALGQQVVVENRGGADGLIAAEAVARSTPDGYTLFFASSGHAINASLYKTVPYRTLEDFEPVALVGESPNLLAVPAALPAKDLREFIAMAKAKPGVLNYGATSSPTHLATELFTSMAGIQLTRIPFKGAAPAMTALISGQVNMMFNSLPGAMAHMKAGRVRAIAMATAKRSSLYPDLPTITESSGLPFDATGWYGVLVPGGTPKPIVAKLHAEVIKALNSPATKDRMTAQGVETVGSTPQEFAARIREDWAKWGKVIAVAGLKQK